MNLPELNYKKIALVVGFSLICLFFAWLIYMFFFASMLAPVNTNTNEPYEPDPTNRNFNANGALPTDKNINQAAIERTRKIQPSGFSEIRKITESSVKGAALASNGSDIIYYSRADGKFYKIDEYGEETLLSEKTFYDVQNVVWSNNKDKAVLEYPDGANVVYDFTKEEQKTIPKNWEDFEFSVDNKKVVTKSFSSYSAESNLVIADISTGQTKIIENLGDKANFFQISCSPDNQIVAFFAELADFDHQEIYFIGQYGENFKSIIVSGMGFKGKWSPDSKKILYRVYSSLSDYKPILWITDKEGSQRMLPVKTWSDKCVFYNNEIIYCGVPQEFGEMAGMFPESSFKFNDDIYKIDIIKNYAEKIQIDKKFDFYNVKEILISKNQDALYFTDGRTGRLYKIEL